MIKFLAILAAVVYGKSRKEIQNLYSSLEGMLSTIEAPSPSSDAYRIAKNARQADAISLHQEYNIHDDFYNKFTGYYQPGCNFTKTSEDGYGDFDTYESAFGQYIRIICSPGYGYYYREIDYIYGRGSESYYSGYTRHFNVHAWNIEHPSLDDVENSVDIVIDASDAFADDLVEVSVEIKRENDRARRKVNKAFDTVQHTAEAIQDIQEEAAR